MMLCYQVMELDRNGYELRSFGGDRGSSTTDQLNWPWYIIVDQLTDDYFIADRNNRRVLQLHSDLRSTGVVIDSPQGPSRLCLAATDKLLIAESNGINIFTLR